MFLEEYIRRLDKAQKTFESEHGTNEWSHPLAITESFEQYRYAMILVLREYIDMYVKGDTYIESIDSNDYTIHWRDDKWSNPRFDDVRQEFIRIILEILSPDESVFLPALAWSNHLEHTGGMLLKDHGNWAGLKEDDIDTISQNSLSVVFPDIFD